MMKKRATCGRHLQPPFQQKCHLKVLDSAQFDSTRTRILYSLFPKNMKQTMLSIWYNLGFLLIDDMTFWNQIGGSLELY